MLRLNQARLMKVSGIRYLNRWNLSVLSAEKDTAIVISNNQNQLIALKGTSQKPNP